MCPADIAKQHPHALELNVLVIGMPNVGKSTLLNTLRHQGIKGRKYHRLIFIYFPAHKL